MKKLCLLIVAVWASLLLQAQTSPSWNGKKCAVVLTYDDALNVHLTNAVPVLDSLGLKATFYISDYFGGLGKQVKGWKAAAAKGHELGNHSMFHPCAGNLPGRSWVPPDYDLSKYTMRRLTDEIRAMNTLLQAIDGKTKRTFAFPCSDTKLNDTAYIDALKNDFPSARAVRSEMPLLKDIDLYDIGCYMVNGQTGDELIALVKEAMEKKRLIVFLFHGVGGEHSLNVSLEAHRQLLKFIRKNQSSIWVPTMLQLTEYVKEKKK
jgi:peptidoglycan/xylan/chitin deacetylase (PgdA/CDA1 family)